MAGRTRRSARRLGRRGGLSTPPGSSGLAACQCKCSCSSVAGNGADERPRSERPSIAGARPASITPQDRFLDRGEPHAVAEVVAMPVLNAATSSVNCSPLRWVEKHRGHEPAPACLCE